MRSAASAKFSNKAAMVELNKFNGQSSFIAAREVAFCPAINRTQFIGHHPLARAQDHCALASAATPSASPQEGRPPWPGRQRRGGGSRALAIADELIE
jgi:hypothetical protein